MLNLIVSVSTTNFITFKISVTGREDSKSFAEKTKHPSITKEQEYSGTLKKTNPKKYKVKRMRRIKNLMHNICFN